MGIRDGAGVVWEIDDERGVHEFLGVIGSRVLHHGDFVPEFNGLPYGRFDVCMRDKAGDNKPLDSCEPEGIATRCWEIVIRDACITLATLSVLLGSKMMIIGCVSGTNKPSGCLPIDSAVSSGRFCTRESVTRNGGQR